MLKEISIADAYGAGFEFSHREKIQRHNNPKNYVVHDLERSKERFLSQKNNKF